jgi:glycosyltransferase involved in cell wall biosynthesis
MSLPKQPGISVIIATYNSAGTLSRALESVLSQTESVELLIVDGGSRDGTMAIVSSYGKSVHWAISEADGGVYDAWNKALEYAGREWVLFLGSDDWFPHSGCLRHALDCAAASGQNAQIVYGSVDVVGPNGEVIRQDNCAIPNMWASLHRGMPFTHTGTLHRLELFARYGLFDSSLRIAGDYDFMLRVLRHETATYCATYKVCMGDGGVSNSRNGRQKLLRELKYIRRKSGLPWSLTIDGYIDLKRLYYKLSS